MGGGDALAACRVGQPGTPRHSRPRAPWNAPPSGSSRVCTHAKRRPIPGRPRLGIRRGQDRRAMHMGRDPCARLEPCRRRSDMHAVPHGSGVSAGRRWSSGCAMILSAAAMTSELQAGRPAGPRSWPATISAVASPGQRHGVGRATAQTMTRSKAVPARAKGRHIGSAHVRTAVGVEALGMRDGADAVGIKRIGRAAHSVSPPCMTAARTPPVMRAWQTKTFPALVQRALAGQVQPLISPTTAAYRDKPCARSPPPPCRGCRRRCAAAAWQRDGIWPPCMTLGERR